MARLVIYQAGYTTNQVENYHMRATVKYPNRSFDVEGLEAPEMEVEGKDRTMGDASYTWVSVDIAGSWSKSMYMAMTPDEARLLGHSLLVAAEKADMAKAARLALVPRRRRRVAA